MVRRSTLYRRPRRVLENSYASTTTDNNRNTNTCVLQQQRPSFLFERGHGQDPLPKIVCVSLSTDYYDYYPTIQYADGNHSTDVKHVRRREDAGRVLVDHLKVVSRHDSCDPVAGRTGLKREREGGGGLCTRIHQVGRSPFTHNIPK